MKFNEDECIAAAQAYAESLNQSIQRVGDRIAPWNVLIDFVTIWPAVDGAMVIFQKRSGETTDGIITRVNRNLETKPLSILVPNRTWDLVRVRSTPVPTSHREVEDAFPPYDQEKHGKKRTAINMEVTRAARAGFPLKEKQVQVLCLAPNELAKNDNKYSSVWSIWSPLTYLPNKTAPVRLSEWVHAVIFLNSDVRELAQTIRAELSVFSLLVAKPTPENRASFGDSPTNAARTLRKECDAFESLLNQVATTRDRGELDKSHEEEIVHQWLNQENHRFFLDPNPKNIWSKIPFGSTVSDFVVQRADGGHILVEIERPTIKIQKKDGTQTAGITHAIGQVRSWKLFIEDHPGFVEQQLNVGKIREPEGLVIIGRRSDIRNTDLWRQLQRQSESIKVITYDEAIDRVRNLAHQLDTLSHD